MRRAVMTAKRVTLWICLVLLAVVSGCSDITEFESTYKAGLFAVNVDDFSVVNAVEDLENASCLLLYPGKVFVVTTDGFIHRYDGETLDFEDSFQVGVPSAAGYNAVVLSPTENTAYLSTSLGKIVEISMPDCQVLAEFSLGPAPTSLCITGGNPEHLFVADAYLSKLYCVRTDDNVSIQTMNFHPLMTPTCMTSSNLDDSLLVGTNAGLLKVELLLGGTLRSTCFESSSWQCLTTIPNDTTFAGVTGYGEFCYLRTFDLWEEGLQPKDEDFSLPLDGDYHFVTPAHDNMNLIVLSHTGDGVSRLMKFSYVSRRVLFERDFPGYPLDLQTGGSGITYLLTYE